MNILIPHSWLLEHLETTATPQDIQKYLSLSGPSVERINKVEGEPVYDIEVTTNRVDSMSVRGIAREAAVILTQAGISATLKTAAPIPSYMGGKKQETVGAYKLPTIINDPLLCGRILCVLLTNVEHVSSPTWMQMRLRQVGLNTHDAIIDITNYVTHDLGHPCHAFDYDKLMKLGGIIKVVRAAKGKKFTTLDNVTYETVGGEVVFENDRGEIIDLPGIKGTANTSIDSSTKNVLFWIESVEPSLIRFTSMTHAIRTVAAQLNEKNVDPHLALSTLAKGVELFISLANATVQKETFTDIFPSQKKMATVHMRVLRIEQYLGVTIAGKHIKDILTSLGCTVKIEGKSLSVTPPTWRPDITIPEDVVEEIARIFGYHNLPSVLMSGAIPTNRPENTDFLLEHEVKSLLATLGGFEVYTYSMISEEVAKREAKSLGENIVKTHVRLKNPLTDDMTYMRRTLWASHIAIITGPTQPFVFELANTYMPRDEEEGTSLPHEELHLTLSSTKDILRVKGMLNALASALYAPSVRYKPVSAQRTEIYSGDVRIGGIVSFTEGSSIDLQWNVLVEIARKYPLVKSIPKVAPIIEDMTFSFPHPPYVQDIIDAIKHVDPLIARVDYKDTYKQNVTCTVYYQPDEEMSTQDVSPYRKEIIAALSKKYNASLVGKM